MADKSAAGQFGGSPANATGKALSILLALLIGFLGIILITFFAHWYEVVIFKTTDPSETQVIVHALTPIVFFLLFVLVAVFNPLLHRFMPALALGTREIMTVLSLWLVTGVICFMNLTVPVLGTIGLVNTTLVQKEGVKQLNVKSYLNLRNFLFYEEAGMSYYYGLGEGTERILPFPRSPELRVGELKDLIGFVAELADPSNPLSKRVLEAFPPETRQLLSGYLPVAESVRNNLADGLNGVIAGPPLYSAALFKGVTISDLTRIRAGANPQGAELALVNRALLDEAFPSLIARRAEGGAATLKPPDVKGVVLLAQKLNEGKMSLAQHLRQGLAEETRKSLAGFVQQSVSVEAALVGELNRFVNGPSLYDKALFARSSIEGDTLRLINKLVLSEYYSADLVKPAGSVSTAFSDQDIRDPAKLAEKLVGGRDEASKYLLGLLTPANRDLIGKYLASASELRTSSDAETVKRILADGLNAAVKGNLLLERGSRPASPAFAPAALSAEDQRLVNRVLLQRGFEGALSASLPPVPQAYSAEAAASAAKAGSGSELSPELRAGDIEDLIALVGDVRNPRKPLSKRIFDAFPAETKQALNGYLPVAEAARKDLADELNRVIAGPLLYDEALFKGFTISNRTRERARERLTGAEIASLNRALLGEAFPGLLAERTEGGGALLKWYDVKGAVLLARELSGGALPLTQRLQQGLSESSRADLASFLQRSAEVEQALLAEFNKLIDGPNLYDKMVFARSSIEGDALRLINRLVLNGYYSADLVKPPMPISWSFFDQEIRDPAKLAERLVDGKDEASKYLFSLLTPATRDMVEECFGLARKLQVSPEAKAAKEALVESRLALEKGVLGDLNSLLGAGSIYDQDRFAKVVLTEQTRAALGKEVSGDALIRLNRTLIEEACPGELAITPATGAALLTVQDFRNLSAFAMKLRPPDAGRTSPPEDPLSEFLYEKLTPETRAAADRFDQLSTLASLSNSLPQGVVEGLNAALKGEILLGDPAFASVTLSPDDQRLVNRLLLQQGFEGGISGLRPSVPWALWWRPLMFWVPLMLVFVVLSASIVRMMHRQWSRHELLTYPLADVSDSFLRRLQGKAFPAAFYDKVFWFGFVLICFIYLVNGLQVWFPNMIKIPLAYYHTEILKEFPFLSKYCAGEAYAFFRAWIYPFIICIAVLLPTEISLTCWLGWMLMVLATGFYFLVTGEVFTGTEVGLVHYGMFVAMMAVILIIGRREYYNVLRCALTFRRTDDEPLRRAADAARVFVLAFVAFAALLTFLGFDWVIAVAMTCAFSLVVLLIARITAEIGDPWLVNFAGISSLMPFDMLGAATFGPRDVTNQAVIRTSLDGYGFSTNSIAAQETTISKVREKERGWFSRAGFNLILAGGICVAMSATIFFTLWDNYSFGSRREQRTYGEGEMGDPPYGAADVIDRLKTEGLLAKTAEATGLSKLHFFKIEWKFWRYFAYGALLVGLCALLRLRFSWWPFHPLPLLFFNTWAMSRLYMPFFLGWLIKAALLRIWGGKVFARAKPFFVGVIVGQIVMAGVWITVNAVYYLLYQTLPQNILAHEFHMFI